MSNRTYVPWPLVETPTGPPIFPFEHCDLDVARKWMGNYGILSIPIGLIYIILIYAGQQLMKNRPPFKLRRTLVAWNLVLAIFSILGFVRILPEFLHLLSQPNGFHRTVCAREGHSMAAAAYSWYFALSKLVELGDTAFIVLRKQRILFLHWYHHATVLLIVWIGFYDYEPAVIRWSGVMNYFVHSIMYTYFMLKAAQFNVPKKLASVITALQLSQMFIGLFVNLYSVNAMTKGDDCYRWHVNVYLILIVYFTYMMLFANFFYKTYVKKSDKQRVKQS